MLAFRTLLLAAPPQSEMLRRPGTIVAVPQAPAQRAAAPPPGPVQGAPPIVPQAPGKIVVQPAPPKTIASVPVGTRVVSQPPPVLPPTKVAVPPKQTPPAPPPPKSAVMHDCRVSTTSTASGKNPPSVPAVGTIPPTPSVASAVCLPNSASVAPQPTGKITGALLVFGAILVLWLIAGGMTSEVL